LASKIILFQEALQYKKTIILYYNNQNYVKMNARVPPILTWHICHIAVDSLALVVSAYILDQSKSHWLLSDALNFVITMSLKFKDEIVSTTFNNLMKEDGNNLSCL
jgi:phage gp36-like protein